MAGVTEALRRAARQVRALEGFSRFWNSGEIDATIDESFDRIAAYIPPSSGEGMGFAVRVKDLIPDLAQAVEDVSDPFLNHEPLFRVLCDQITYNCCKASGVRYPPTKETAKLLLRPSQYRFGDPVHTFLARTPIEQVFDAEITVTIPARDRYEGCWILGRQGSGKTQCIQYHLMHDLDLVVQGKASIVVMDSQGNTPGDSEKGPTLLHTLSHLKVFSPGEPLHDRLVYIDPADDPSVPFNIFDLGVAGNPEQRFSATRELLEFVFTALAGEKFSGPMSALFTHALRLMLSIPGATLGDLHRLLLRNGEVHHKDEIARLDEDSRVFFEHQFNTAIMRPSREGVLNRLSTLDNYPAFKRLISHPKTEFDLFSEIEQGKVIVIDTNAGALQPAGTEIVGRFILSLLAAVSRKRIGLPEGRKTPCFVFIDEIADYCKNNANHLGTILALCRKQNIAICVANQYLSQIPDPDVQAALLSCGVKFGNTINRDAQALCRDMGDTNSSLLVNKVRGTFALHVTGMQHAVSIKIPYPNLSALPQMTDADYAGMRDQIRSRYCGAPEEPKRPEPKPTEDNENTAASGDWNA